MLELQQQVRRTSAETSGSSRGNSPVSFPEACIGIIAIHPAPFRGRFEGSSRSFYTNMDRDRVVTGAFNQFNQSASTYLSQDYDLAFRRQGKPNTPQLTAEIEYANNYNENNLDLSGVVLQSDSSTPSSILAERDHTLGRNPYLNAKLDYSLPINRNTKFETGSKAIWRRTRNDFTASYEDCLL